MQVEVVGTDGGGEMATAFAGEQAAWTSRGEFAITPLVAATTLVEPDAPASADITCDLGMLKIVLVGDIIR